MTGSLIYTEVEGIGI